MVVDRIVCVLIGGEVPLPLATDPTALTFATGGLPLFGIEALLLGMVVLFDWVEGERLRRGLDDHRTALGRADGLSVRWPFPWAGEPPCLGAGPSSERGLEAASRGHDRRVVGTVCRAGTRRMGACVGGVCPHTCRRGGPFGAAASFGRWLSLHETMAFGCQPRCGRLTGCFSQLLFCPLRWWASHSQRWSFQPRRG